MPYVLESGDHQLLKPVASSSRSLDETELGYGVLVHVETHFLIWQRHAGQCVVCVGTGGWDQGHLVCENLVTVLEKIDLFGTKLADETTGSAIDCQPGYIARRTEALTSCELTKEVPVVGSWVALLPLVLAAVGG